MADPPQPRSFVSRRVHDALRTQIVTDGFPDGRLPTEEELRAEFQVSRAAVRDVLTRLQQEGLVVRLRGIGTIATHRQVTVSLQESHGVSDPAPTGIFDGAMRTRILDWADASADAGIAHRLGVEPGDTVLRVDYVAMLNEAPLGLATNYTRYPQAGLLRRDMFGVDWYRMLRSAGIDIGESTFLFEASQADTHDARLLGVAEGEPVLLGEQVIRTAEGAVFDVAFIRNPGHRLANTSSYRRAPAELEPDPA
ncbi:GntR family transcriptional regulator [Tsukamurella sp. 8F]|uniref:GntR family transcriptional regulator n=1 Tax=unclassified Tsukamurella TaxID=2633480 RepID=UPI0023B89ABD|nr:MULTISPECIES: GntR family transcriptional regulator [unclassified Tsukamurella]MDF0528969.1 GntR family transcriptional regulator [Tsukamurella sp. 8J]MDF0587342.1 GntR family transcriptional regulator [Tsukamurella sp. 8F]